MTQNPGNNPRRVVTFSPEAENDLNEIYDNTADYWGDQQAEDYSAFLLDSAQALADAPTTAPRVPNFAGVRVYVAKWKNARQSHRILRPRASRLCASCTHA